MNRQGRVAAFVLGLIAGIFNIIYGVIIFILGGVTLGSVGSLASAFGLGYMYNMSTGVAWFLLFLYFAFSLINLIGGCIVRRSRVAGGVMMIITSLPFLILSLILMAIPNVTGPILFLYFPFQVMSFIASIIAFVPPRVPSIQPNAYQRPPYGPASYVQPSGQAAYGVPQYTQPQAPPYGAPQYAQPQAPPYGAPQYAQPQAPPYGAPQYAQPQTPPYGAPQYAQPQAPPYGGSSPIQPQQAPENIRRTEPDDPSAPPQQ
jgi:hypothetical protein